MFGTTHSVARLLTGIGLVSLAAGAMAQLSRPTYTPLNFADRPVDLNRGVTRSQVNTNAFFPQVSETRGGRGVRPENPRVTLNIGPNLPPQPVVDTPGRSFAEAETRFPGINFTGSFPPDTHIAVGDDFVVMVVNSTIAFFRKSNGQRVFQSNLDRNAFLSGVSGVGDFIFDPKVFYDPVRRRFYAVVLDVDFNANTSAFIVMGSDDADPRGTWNIVRVVNTGNVGGGEWGDYPGWGFSSTHLAATFNMFPFNNGGVYTRAMGMPWSFVDSGTGQISALDIGDRFTVQLARSDGNNTDIWGVARNGNSQVSAIRLTPNGTTFTRATFNVGITPFNSGPSEVNANGFSIDTINDRVMCSFIRGNRLVAAWTAAGTANGTSSVRWAELRINSPSSVTLAAQGQVNGAPGLSLLQPAITITPNGSKAMVFTQCGPAQSPQVAAAVKSASDPSPNFGPVQVLFTPTQVTGAGSSRWGDYAGIQTDPLVSGRVWGAHQIFTGSNGTWSTQILSFAINTVVPANLLSINPLYGSYISGNATSVQAGDDDNTYQVLSQAVDRTGQYAGVEAVVDTVEPDPVNNTQTLQVDLRASVTGENTPAFVYVWNFRTNTWVSLGSTRLTSTPSSRVFATQRVAADYIDANRQARIRVVAMRAVRTGRVPPLGFTLSIDQLEVGSRPIN